MTENSVDRQKRGEYHRAHHMPTVLRLARDMQRADPSDPFVARRVLAHLTQGIAELDDYAVEWVAQTRRTTQGTEFVVQVPVNMRRL